jgi:hypothetical protein
VKITIDTAELVAANIQRYDEDGNPMPSPDFHESVVEAVARIVAGDVLTKGSLAYDIRQEVAVAITEEVKRQAVELVRQAVAAPVRPSTAWGDRTGEETTVREMVRKELQEFVKPTKPQRYRDSYDKTPHNLGELIASLAKEVWTSELQKEAQEAKAQVTGEVRKKALAAAVRVLNGERP